MSFPPYSKSFAHNHKRKKMKKPYLVLEKKAHVGKRNDRRIKLASDMGIVLEKKANNLINPSSRRWACMRCDIINMYNITSILPSPPTIAPFYANTRRPSAFPASGE